eukprot:CAMPEP_0204603108 /NCGR_PEP_ID=MMETSP0661-20131031/57056_1 /ASSEMBLY_ACC=CAM_ASM_000606 /TAXON_ID=109239 /ORGANISM="Alexandrium margalefi, Strain AMGDE01CS-322" /LENGTH=158 /DNA_ID=CAMNT_0051614147 /DNA_START=71 /DNA_END=550 /DNA_ORIENTATION=+
MAAIRTCVAMLGLMVLTQADPMIASSLRGLSGTRRCGALFCADNALCCDQAPAALCGSPESTCCYNPSKTMANLCAPGTHCDASTGHCYIGMMATSNSSIRKCGAIICAPGSVCCDGAPAALCGAPGTTCCYNPGRSIANLCAAGSHCNAETGNCYAR